MSKDYIPDNPEDLAPWCESLEHKVADIHPADVPAMTAGKLAQLTGPLAQLRLAAKAVVDARVIQRAKEAALADLRASLIPVIHDEVGDLKRMEGITPEMISTMDITSHQAGFDRATYQPKLKAEAHAGHVLLTARKLGVQAMNYYMRRRGTAAWTLIAANRTKSPVRDDSPLAAPGVAEWREYRCVGVIADQEIGQPSAIVEMLYGG